MPRPSGGTVTIRVVHCTEFAGCFRWLIMFGDGRPEERSAYAYATAEGAKLVGTIRGREVGGRS